MFSQFCLATPRQDNMVGEEKPPCPQASFTFANCPFSVSLGFFGACTIYGQHLGQGVGQTKAGTADISSRWPE